MYSWKAFGSLEDERASEMLFYSTTGAGVIEGYVDLREWLRGEGLFGDHTGCRCAASRKGKLIYQSIGRDGATVEMKRLPPAEERVMLGEMERQLEQRGLSCARATSSSSQAIADATARRCWSIRRSS